MRCERCMELYIESDNREDLPFFARLHISTCEDCRRKIDRLEAARRELLLSLPGLAKDSSALIMAAVLKAERPHKEVRLREWIVSFLVILLSMALAPLGSDFHWAKSLFGSNYLLPFSLFFGVALTVYCVLFIVSHIDYLTERLGIEK